jgi:2'-5' RNA ligase
MRARGYLMVATELPNEMGVVSEGTANARTVRIFVALRIAPEIARKLARYGDGLERWSIRPVPAADIHLTLVPPWNEVSIPDAIDKLRRVAELFTSFTLSFCHVGYGPEPRRPRFLWAECIASKEIADLRAALFLQFEQTDERPFCPHVTLARLRDKGRVIARKYPVDRELAFAQRVDSVELMQSPPPGGSGYTVLASLPLGAGRGFMPGA